MSASTGRGGAGNMSSKTAMAAPSSQDLATPTIKSDVYTTGRGGSGNMAQNLSGVPEYARAAQDVGAPPMKLSSAADDAGAITYTGRGGGGNVLRGGERQGSFNGSKSERDAAREKLRAGHEAEMSGANGGSALQRERSNEKRGTGERRGSNGIVGMGKDLIDRIRGESRKRESAKGEVQEKK